MVPGEKPQGFPAFLELARISLSDRQRIRGRVRFVGGERYAAEQGTAIVDVRAHARQPLFRGNHREDLS
jgi:hypothetical protein